MEKEATTNDLLEAINAFSGETDKRLDDINKKFEKVGKRLTKIEAVMVTKDYLDGKMSDLRGDLTILTRKEDIKVKKLIEILKRHKLMSDKEVKEIMAMEPFPQLVL